ncbi:hypothetical protein DYB32_004763 [Aphanomyces invadans]|uniref:Protein kinase domain-containing protein n=1 Tax=Aphanomyces invadans TaxID=157072 RepID=A0A418AWM9_9STRA|nr:hypothetical protein DYB32_004763 [Aphanomyces invadans]
MGTCRMNTPITTTTTPSAMDGWLGSRDPRSYRRVFVYYVFNWVFAVSLWIGFIASFALSVLTCGLILLFWNRLRRRRVVYKLVAYMWTHEITLMNLVSPTSLSHVSHWDLTRESVVLSVAYFVVWKGCVGWLLTSLPLVLFVLDSTYLSALNINIDVLSSELDEYQLHPLVARVGILAYFALCLWACDLALTVLAQMTAMAYAKIFEAPELFRRDLQSTFPHSPLSFPIPPTLRQHPTVSDARRHHHPLTTYSRVTTGRTCLAETMPPVVTGSLATSCQAAPTVLPAGSNLLKPLPSNKLPGLTTIPLAISSTQSPRDDDSRLVSVPEKLVMSQLRVATAAPPLYECLSPTAPRPLSSYAVLSPSPVSPGQMDHDALMTRTPVSRALPESGSHSAIPREPAHFAMYGPPVIRGTRPFSLHLWAFAATQRADMHAMALESTGHRSLSRETMLDNVRHGTLVHATLDVPCGFDLLHPFSASLSMVWTGELHRLTYRLQRHVGSADTGHVLFKVTLVVGAVVRTLRSYVLVHGVTAPDAVSADDVDDGDVVQPLECVMEVLPDSFREIPYSALDIQEWIGSGAGGDAYRAMFNGQEVVVKTIRASEYGTSGDAIQAAFQHEAAVLNRFGHHPHMVPFVGACSDLSYPLSIVTAYMPHGSLESHLMPGASSLLDKNLLLADIAAAACTIHDSGFVHRDLAARYANSVGPFVAT